jgi:hypothetical protein
VIDPIPSDMVRGGKVFGPELPAPAGAAEWEALLAWSGRDPSWTSPSS